MEDFNIVGFREQLKAWHAQQDRAMPWKQTRDPYRIWLSEIILQQTRVAQGLPYYLRFVETFPTVQDLAQASQEQVFKCWEGLGYYRRATHLHETAQTIVHTHQGVFPKTYEAIRALKGVGDYTAAAIASFAFDLPHAVLDGNVFRVLARLTNCDLAIDSTEGKKHFAALAQTWLDTDDPAAYNQAIMDFGALQCLPAQPLCTTCPLQSQCRAYAQNRVGELPRKAKKIKTKERFFYYFVFRQAGDYWLRKRTASDIWQHLYEYPMIEAEEAELSLAELLSMPQWQAWLGTHVPLHIGALSAPLRQQLTHQRITGRFVQVQLPSDFQALAPDWERVHSPQDRPLPKLLQDYSSDVSQQGLLF